MQILVLSEGAVFVQDTADLTEYCAPLRIGHKTQGQRRNDRIDMLAA